MSMNINNGNVRQGLNASPTSRQELRDELEKEWNRLPRGKSPQPDSPKSPTKFNLDMNAVRAAQQTITQPIIMQTVSQTTSSTTTSSTTTTTTWTSPSTDSVPGENTPRENTCGKKNNDSEESSFEKSSSSARSYRDSPRKNEVYPHSSRVRSPSATKKMAASHQNSPATTPRDENGCEDNKTPRSPRGNMRELRKIVSRKFSEIDLSGITSSVKEAASSMKEALSPTGTPRKHSPLAKSKDELLALISIADRNQMAMKILKLKESQDFNKAPAAVQAMLMHATLLEELPEDSPLRTIEGIRTLLDDVELRNENYRIDTVVDLSDPKFINHINSKAKERFVDKWMNDNSTMDEDLKKHLIAVQPTFARDFDASTYQVLEADGSLRTLKKIDEFITYINEGSKSKLSMVVSNITSQNLGIFFKNVLFERQDTNGNYHSILKLYDGTSIKPHANVKATYVFSKDEDGTILVDYAYKSSDALNGNKEIAAMECTAWNTHVMKDVSLTIKSTITIKSDGEWHIGNPHVQAEGWNQTPKY